MEKISVSIRIPALDVTHDFIIPSTMIINDVKQLVMEIVCSEYGINKQADDIVIIDKADGKVLCMDSSLEQMGIGDGANLILL